MFLRKTEDGHPERKKEQKRKKGRPVETGAADGNLPTPLIPTAA
jgi:hypothetical protein